MDRVYSSVAQFIGDYPEEFRTVRDILVEYWDPVIVQSKSGSTESIDPFVPAVVFLGLDRRSVVHIADFLAESEAGLLGLAQSTPQQWLRCKKAAEAIIEYFINRMQETGQ